MSERQVGPGSYVAPTVELGDNVVIGRNAIIDGAGRLDDGVVVGHGAVIQGEFSIGKETSIGHHTVIQGRNHVGVANEIGPFCSFGTQPQYPTRRHEKSTGRIILGNNNIIREYTSITLPMEDEETSVGDDCYIMSYSHVGHDCRIGRGVIMTNEATLGGHVHVHDYANIGLNVAVHQWCHIGAYAMVGMGSAILRDVMPFCTFSGGRSIMLNLLGMRRNGVKDEDIKRIGKLYSKFSAQEKVPKDSWYGRMVALFVEESKRGCYPPPGKPEVPGRSS